MALPVLAFRNGESAPEGVPQPVIYPAVFVVTAMGFLQNLPNQCRVIAQILHSFAIVDTAGEHDNKRAREICAGIEACEIVVFDMAYVDFDQLADRNARGVWWVTRARDNIRFRVRRNWVINEGKIVRDPIGQIEGGKVIWRVAAWGEELKL